jgi:TolB protein
VRERVRKLYPAAVLVILSPLAATDFIPMTPIGAECIPVTVTVTGTDPALTEDAEAQLIDDIDFSGLLEVSDEGYADVEVTVASDSRGILVKARVACDGELLMVKEYSGSSVYPLIHALADDLVYQITGEQGIASTRLAFIVRNGEIYHLAVKGMDPRPAFYILTDDEVITTPAWSPGGDIIAFTSYRSGYGDLYTYSFSDGTASKILSMGGLNTSPAWSPDGADIALTLSEEGNSDIFVYGVDSGELQRLTARNSIETSASFSPAGHQIIFTSDRIGYPQLYIMDSGGGGADRATFSHGYCDSPSWSPTGERIAYTARSGGDFHIFVMDSDGSDIRQVTFDGTLNEDPVWSPTGRHLAFSSDMDGERAIYLLELNRLTLKKLSESGESYCATWSPLQN